MRHRLIDCDKLDVMKTIKYLYNMKQYTIARLLIVLFSLGVIQGCDREDILLNQPNEEVRSLGGFLANNYEYTLFSAALKYTGLLDTLTHGTGPLTVLAPSDDAFRAIGITRPSDFQRMDKDSLRYVMAYHILPFRLNLSDVPMNQAEVRYETLAGEQLYANRYLFRNDYRRAAISNSSIKAMMVTFSGAEVANCISLSNTAAPPENVGDIPFSNGVLHSLTKLMKPYPDQTVQDWLAANSDYSIFVAGLKKFGLWDELATKGPFTIFAPVNSELRRHGMTEASIAAMDVDIYIGERLFGSYIFYGQQIFIKDYYFYLSTEDQFWYVSQVRNDGAYNRIFTAKVLFGTDVSTGTYEPSFANRFLSDNVPRFYTYDYTLGVSKGTTPYLYFLRTIAENEDAFLGTGPADATTERYMVRGNDQHKNDHLCTNGVVHHLDGTLVFPEEALVSEN